MPSSDTRRRIELIEHRMSRASRLIRWLVSVVTRARRSCTKSKVLSQDESSKFRKQMQGHGLDEDSRDERKLKLTGKSQ